MVTILTWAQEAREERVVPAAAVVVLGAHMVRAAMLQAGAEAQATLAARRLVPMARSTPPLVQVVVPMHQLALVWV
jgi:hypothetical protein